MPAKALKRIAEIIKRTYEQLEINEANAEKLKGLWKLLLEFLADPFADQNDVDHITYVFLNLAYEAGFGNDFIEKHKAIIDEKNALRIKAMEQILQELHNSEHDESTLVPALEKPIEEFTLGFAKM